MKTGTKRKDQGLVHLEYSCEILYGDSLDELDKLNDKSIQLIVTSPPYNIGKEYETDRKMSLPEYLEWLDPIIEKLCSKLKDGGSLCWQVGNHVSKGEVYPLDCFFYGMLTKHGLRLRNRVIWRFNFGLHASSRLSGRYETLLWFTKGDDYKFNLDPIRVPQLYPGKRHSRKKGDKAGHPSGNPIGKNPSDYWEFSGEDAFIENPIWDIPNVKANHPEKTLHPCQFPIELVERCILAFSDEGDVVLDPFVGVGTTLIAATKHKRSSIGIDKDERYVSLAEERVALFNREKLPMRKSGKKVERPKAGTKVATVPSEWNKHKQEGASK